MPVVQVWMHKGRTQAQKDALIAEVTKAVSSTVNCPPSAVHVVIIDVEKTDWGIGGKNCA